MSTMASWQGASLLRRLGHSASDLQFTWGLTCLVWGQIQHSKACASPTILTKCWELSMLTIDSYVKHMMGASRVPCKGN